MADELTDCYCLTYFFGLGTDEMFLYAVLSRKSTGLLLSDPSNSSSIFSTVGRPHKLDLSVSKPDTGFLALVF